ncbi:alpha-L-fucosidase [Vagococcus elongatus]|uniref:alpha-L-fucosidase n=1 Tax=Vagococcus elongatus TaxID=180344 RepID=A0A430ANZ0_9ENTE|nr:alpha-L-fucosidase [Vagococcus elongatus]RSU09819.1 alpha-L-fucosidase [Vagococcus elongatus]
MSKIRNDIEENHDTARETYSSLSTTLKDKIEWFKDQKIGVIFHWGLYSLAGIVESWQLSEEDDWARKKPWRDDLNLLRRDYWSLNKSFNPKNFDPASWAKQSKNAGFKYMLFTTKHHDGFNMYDTQYSDYKVTDKSCPYSDNPQADIFGMVAKSFREEELSVGAYYSKADWHSPFYWVPNQHPKGRYASYNPIEEPETWKKFNQFVENQLTEICQNYGDLDILWLDGGWVNSANNEYLEMETIVPKLRETQPDLLVVDRTIGGDFENYVTPERKIPEVLPAKAWESNIPLAKNWGYVPNDQYKSFSEILETVVRVVSLGGNIVLGIGPKPDGSLPEEAQKIMDSLGEWLSVYGEGIYGTRPHSIHSIDEWHFTKKENLLFAFLIPNKEEKHPYTLNLNELNLNQKIKSCHDMYTEQPLEIISNSVTVSNLNHEIIGIKFNLENEEK